MISAVITALALFAPGALAETPARHPRALLNTFVEDLNMPKGIKGLIFTVANDPDGFSTRVRDVVARPATDFGDAAAEVNQHLGRFGLRLGLAPEQIDEYATSGSVSAVTLSEAEYRLAHLRPKTRKALEVLKIDSAAALSARYSAETLVRAFSPAEGAALLAYAAHFGHPLARGTLAGLSPRLQNELHRLHVTDARGFAARFTYRDLDVVGNLPAVWVEMLDFCFTQGHPVRSGAVADAVRYADDRRMLSPRAKALLDRLGVADAAALAAGHSLRSLRTNGVGIKLLIEIMNWAETYGAPLAVTEAERLARCPERLAHATAAAPRPAAPR